MPRVTGDSRRSGCRRDSRSPRAGATVRGRQQRGDDGQQGRAGHRRVERVARQAVDEEQRRERQGEDDRRPDGRAGGLEGGVQVGAGHGRAALRRVGLLAQAGRGSVDVADGVVDDEGQRDRQPGDDDRVERRAEGVDDEPGDDERERHGDQRGERGPPREEQQEQGHHEQDPADDGRPDEVALGLVGVGRRPEDRGVHVQAREARPEVVERLVHALLHRLRCSRTGACRRRRGTSPATPRSR